MSHLSETIHYFTAYLAHRIDEEELKKRMMVYRENRKIQIKDFYETIVDTDPAIIKEVQKLLTELKIPQSKWVNYLNRQLSLYEILIEAKKSIYGRVDLELDLVIDLVQKKTAIITHAVAINAFLAALLLIVLICAFPPSFVLFQYCFNPAGGLPYVGFIYNATHSIYDMLHNFYEGKSSLAERSRKAAFQLLNLAFNTAGYITWIIAASTMTPVSAVLFVIASSISVAKEIFYATDLYILYKNRPVMDSKYGLDERMLSLRLEYSYKRHRNNAAISFIFSLIMFGLMATWCFAPGGAPMVAGVIVGIIVFQAMKHYLLRWHEEYMRKSLVRELIDMEAAHKEKEGIPLQPTGPGCEAGKNKPHKAPQPIKPKGGLGFFTPRASCNGDLVKEQNLSPDNTFHNGFIRL